jgi:hypothetical protein
MQFHSLKRSALIGLSALTLASAALAPSAFAEPKGGPGGSRGCPVEDEHGNVSYVPVGTVIGLFHCGSDGDWHFGWLTTDLQTTGGATGGGGKASQFGNTASTAQFNSAP